jgi:hypothetical protein
MVFNMMYRCVVLAALTAALPAWAETASTPSCYCTGSRGERVELGETVCLTVGGRSFLALCDMSLNNPAWRDTGQPCVSSFRFEGPERVEPALHAGAVHPHVGIAMDRPGIDREG